MIYLSVNHVKMINYFEKLSSVTQIFIAERTLGYIFSSWIGILLLRTINASVISSENEMVKEA